jgi:hypothetical protein
MPKQITLIISSDGNVTAVSHGRQGKKCLEDLDLISDLVGESVVVDSSLTDEFNLEAQSNHVQIDQDWAK